MCGQSEHTHTESCYPAATAEPTAQPTPVPTAVPTAIPTAEPTPIPTPTRVPGAVPPPASTLEPSMGSQTGPVEPGGVRPPAATLEPGALAGKTPNPTATEDISFFGGKQINTPTPAASVTVPPETWDDGDDEGGVIRIHMSASSDVVLLGQTVVWEFEARSEEKLSLSWQLFRDGWEIEKGTFTHGERLFSYTPTEPGYYAFRLTAEIVREDGGQGETKSKTVKLRAVEQPELTVTAQAGARSCFGGDTVRFALTRSANEFAQAAEASVTVWQDGAIIYESDEFSDVVSVTPVELDYACTVRLTVTLKNRFGQTADATAEIPCAMHETENSAVWELTMKDATLTGIWPEDILTIARTQLGYHESALDFIVDEEENRQGWTRYGAWYGMPYEEWCSMFVSFCLHYAKVPEWAVPQSASQQRLLKRLEEKGLYAEREGAEPRPGDLIFFDHELEGEEGHGTTDHIGIVSDVDDERVYTIEGNSNLRVRECNYLLTDEHIAGYGLVNKAYEADLVWEEESGDPTPTDEAAIEVLEGSVPAGSTVQYGQLSREEAEKLAMMWLSDSETERQDAKQAMNRSMARLEKAAQNGQVTGYAAFEIGIETEGEAYAESGRYRVTVTPDLNVWAELPEGASVTGTEYALYHIHGGSAERLAVDVSEEEGVVESLVFETDGFSAFVLVFTVDFTYVGEDGELYTFSLDGGDAVSLRELLIALKIADEGTEATDDRQDVESLLQAIESVDFSDESLIRVVRIEEDTSAGALKEALGIESEYTAALTQSQIERIDARRFTAPDWALISLKAFDSEEALTITLNDGRIITIEVTDAQITAQVVTADGATYAVTVTYDEDAGIPEDAVLEASEMTAEDEAYADYLNAAAGLLGVDAGSVSYAKLLNIAHSGRRRRGSAAGRRRQGGRQHPPAGQGRGRAGHSGRSLRRGR